MIDLLPEVGHDGKRNVINLDLLVATHAREYIFFFFIVSIFRLLLSFPGNILIT